MAKRFKLSKKKQRWAASTKPSVTLRGSALNYPVGVEKKYTRDVRKLLASVIKTTEREVRKIFATPEAKAFYAEDENLSDIARGMLEETFQKIESIAAKRAEVLVETMVAGADKSSQASIAASLKELSGGVTIRPDKIGGDIAAKLKAATNVNADLIKTISGQYLASVSDAVNRSIMLGRGLEDLIPFLAKHKGITQRHAKNMALDQTRKAYNSLNVARMENAGLTEFEWLHSGGGQRPRKLHITRYPAGLNGGIFEINDPPIIDEKTGERGLPSQAINCKCRMLPVLRLDKGKAA